VQTTVHGRPQVRGQAVEAFQSLHRTHPRQLALGQLTRGGDASVAQRREIEGPVEVFPDLPVAHGAHGRKRRREREVVAQAPDFIDQPLLQHLVEAPGNACVQGGAVARLQCDAEETVRAWCFASTGDQGRHRRTGYVEYFERTLYALRIAGLQSLGGDRIDT